jgi:hypothetical protein
MKAETYYTTLQPMKIGTTLVDGVFHWAYYVDDEVSHSKVFILMSFLKNGKLLHFTSDTLQFVVGQMVDQAGNFRIAIESEIAKALMMGLE